MMRKILCAGDVPKTGGQVLPPSAATCLIGNRQAALIGGQAFCAACGQTGIIIKAGGPYRPCYPGGEGALEFDVLQCGCQPLPKLLVVTHNQAKVEDQNQGITD